MGVTAAAAGLGLLGDFATIIGNQMAQDRKDKIREAKEAFHRKYAKEQQAERWAREDVKEAERVKRQEERYKVLDAERAEEKAHRKEREALADKKYAARMQRQSEMDHRTQQTQAQQLARQAEMDEQRRTEKQENTRRRLMKEQQKAASPYAQAEESMKLLNVRSKLRQLAKRETDIQYPGWTKTSDAVGGLLDPATTRRGQQFYQNRLRLYNQQFPNAGLLIDNPQPANQNSDVLDKLFKSVLPPKK